MNRESTLKWVETEESKHFWEQIEQAASKAPREIVEKIIEDIDQKMQSKKD